MIAARSSADASRRASGRTAADGRKAAPLLFKFAIAPCLASVYTAAHFPGIAFARADGRWALSSAVEHYLDMVGVRGSIPLAPTISSPLSDVRRRLPATRSSRPAQNCPPPS